MRKAIATGVLGLVLFSNGAAAQTAVERGQILRDFERSLVEYTQQHTSLAGFPGAVAAASPAPKIFTPPVAMVFRQTIARALAKPSVGSAISGHSAAHRAAVMQPFPANALTDFPKVLGDALPALPAPLEYRLIDNDLVIRDTTADLIIAVLHPALGAVPAR
ncbi:MAG TPA: hypothetical protein VNT81_07960 [Vicinamibacterales bacterium]|nr:hypothetical protein [Vicinamibacterales bacterium]